MKEKEEWAQEFLEQQDISDELVRTLLIHGWLAGFEFAKTKCSEEVCDCCSNVQTVRDLGENELDKKISPPVVPIPPLTEGETILCDGKTFDVTYHFKSKNITIWQTFDIDLRPILIGKFKEDNPELYRQVAHFEIKKYVMSLKD